MKFDLIKTNIVNVSSDAIVLPANSKLKEGSGSSTAIFEAAGRKKLTQACKRIGYCRVGSAVPTPAFNLDAKYIIHAVVPKWIDGNSNEYELLSTTYLTSLQLADVIGCESIAFPLLASGNNGYDKEIAFLIAQDSISSFEGTNLKKVFIVVYGDWISSFLREKGYKVIEIPEDLKKDQKRDERNQKVEKIVADGKEILDQFVQNQIQKGMDYLKDEKNQEKILKAGIAIAKKAINSKIGRAHV